LAVALSKAREKEYIEKVPNYIANRARLFQNIKECTRERDV
jgi:hypothetical protein